MASNKYDFFEEFMSKFENKAMPLNFTRFYLTTEAMQLNNLVNRLFVEYKLSGKVDIELYKEALIKLTDLVSYVHNLVKDDRQDLITKFLSELIEMNSSEIIDISVVFEIKNLIMDILFEKGLLNVFQIREDTTITDLELEDDEEEVGEGA